jgi:hypothetical protein
MYALFDFTPKFCPNCGEPTGFSKMGWDAFDYNHYAAHSCRHCGLHFQRADETTILDAAEKAGGDMKYHATKG